MELSRTLAVTIKKVAVWIWHVPRNVLALLIGGYQKVFSPDHGLLRHVFPHGYCKYQPSCSEYTRQSLLKYGVVRGGLKAFWRILRCNPWSGGGRDEV